MNRCLIYVHYDREGIIRKSTIQILKEFRNIVDYIYFVSNNELCDTNQITTLTDQIVLRKNQGYDAGAYRDILLNDDFDNCEQLIFCNNTFWGPFVSLDTLFYEMDGRKTDYWGLAYSGKNLVHHIQSYFMVFNKKVIPEVKKYFTNYISSLEQNYREVCRTFEIGLNDYLLKKGFCYGAYSDGIAFDSYTDPYGSIKYDKLPILKKKFFEIKNYNALQAKRTLDYIKQRYHYDISIIIQEIYDLYKIEANPEPGLIGVKPEINQNNKMKKWNDLSKFVQQNEEICVFGTGNVLKQVLDHFFSGNDSSKLVSIVGLGKIENIEKREAEQWYYIYKDYAIIVCVEEEDVDKATTFFKKYAKAFFIWKDQSEYENNTIKISDSIITAYGKLAYYRSPLAVIDEEGQYCGLITEKELMNKYSFSEETPAMVVADITVPVFTDNEEAEQYVAKNGQIVPVVDKKGKYIKLIGIRPE